MSITQTNKETEKSSLLNGGNMEAISTVTEKLNEVGQDVKAASQDAVARSVEYTKEHPIQTALGAGALGFIAGFIARKLR